MQKWLLFLLTCTYVGGAVAQVPVLTGSFSYRTVFAYDALLQLFNGYKYSGSFTVSLADPARSVSSDSLAGDRHLPRVLFS